MSGEFCQFAGQYVRQKINPEKCPDTVFGLLDLQLMKIAHISCIFSIKFAVFTEYRKTSIQTKRSPVIFVQQISFLSEKIFQSVRQLSQKISRRLQLMVNGHCSSFTFDGCLPWYTCKWAWQLSWSCHEDAANKLLSPSPPFTNKIWLSLAKQFRRRRSLKMVDDDNGRTPKRG